MTPSDEQIRSAIAQQAAEWFMAHQSGSLGEGDAAEFLGWLKASPVHVREYLGVARVARHLPTAAGEPKVPLETFLAQAAADDGVVSLEKHAPQKSDPRPVIYGFGRCRSQPRSSRWRSEPSGGLTMGSCSRYRRPIERHMASSALSGCPMAHCCGSIRIPRRRCGTPAESAWSRSRADRPS